MKLLIIGDTTELAYLAFVFHQLHWTVTYYDNCFTPTSKIWKIIVNDQIFEFPVVTIHNLDAVDHDIIIFDELFYSQLINSRYKLREDTLVLVNCCLNLWLYEKVNNVLPNAVMAVYSEVQCRKLNSDTFKIIHNGFKTMFGVLSQNNLKSQLLTVMNFDQKGMVFLELKKVMKSHNNSLVVLSPDSSELFRKFIWKNIIRIVSFHCLSVIFEDSDYFKLAQMPDLLPILKGSFNEILDLISRTDSLDFPLPESDESIKLLQIMILKETNLLLSLTSPSHTIPFLHTNQRYYNFINGFEHGSSPLLSNLLSTCEENGLDTPFLQSISYFLSSMRQKDVNPMLRRKSLTKKSIVNGIYPEENMMNFPPFNPLPLPSPALKSYPLIMMVKQESDNESIVSIDPLVREAYEETFYDSTPVQPEGPPNVGSGVVTGPLPSGSMHLVSGPMNLGGQMNSGVTMPLVSGGMPGGPMPPNGTMSLGPIPGSLPGPNFYTQPVPLPIQYPMTYTKLPTYHHLPHLDKLSSAKLREYHDNVMESVKFNPANLPSRYGKYDTSLVLLKKK